MYFQNLSVWVHVHTSKIIFGEQVGGISLL